MPELCVSSDMGSKRLHLSQESGTVWAPLGTPSPQPLPRLLALEPLRAREARAAGTAEPPGVPVCRSRGSGPLVMMILYIQRNLGASVLV